MLTPHDESFETHDTIIDLRAVDDGLEYDGLDTIQEDALPPEDLDPTALTQITGGMRWEELRRSSNIEDRRSPAAIRRDQQWWEQTHGKPAAAPVPLPPRRPDGL